MFAFVGFQQVFNYISKILTNKNKQNRYENYFNEQAKRGFSQ